MTSRGIFGRIALIALACFAATVPASALQPHSPVFVDSNQPVIVPAGETFFVALASNATTGYTWSQSIGDGAILAYEGNVYQPPRNAMPGAGGQQLFIYHANRGGSTQVRFNYARPFEPNVAPAQTLVFNVTVQ
jgi:inhibitor of cysteine peptidase